MVKTSRNVKLIDAWTCGKSYKFPDWFDVKKIKVGYKIKFGNGEVTYCEVYVNKKELELASNLIISRI